MKDSWIDEPVTPREGESADALAYRVREIKRLKLKCLDQLASVEEMQLLLKLTRSVSRLP